MTTSGPNVAPATRLSGRYDKLAAAVDGRRLTLACRKHVRFDHPPGALTIRFNQDSLGADIHAVNFYQDAASPAISSAGLVIGTVPKSNVQRPDLKIRKDFLSDIRTFQDIASPIEFVTENDWIALAVQMPVFPLSGIIVAAMLETTRFERCDMLGMDFYEDDQTIALRPDGRRGKHHLPSARAWLVRMLHRDDRFRWVRG